MTEDAAQMHRDAVTTAPPAGSAESEDEHDTGASARWRRAFAEHDKTETN